MLKYGLPCVIGITVFVYMFTKLTIDGDSFNDSA